MAHLRMPHGKEQSLLDCNTHRLATCQARPPIGTHRPALGHEDAGAKLGDEADSLRRAHRMVGGCAGWIEATGHAGC